MENAGKIGDYEPGYISFKQLLVLLSIIVLLHFFLIYTQNGMANLTSYIFSILGPAVAGTLSLLVYSRSDPVYSGLQSNSFRFSYLALGISLILTSFVKSLMLMDDYSESRLNLSGITTVLSLPFYPLVLVYLYLNTRFFKPTFSVKHFGIVMLPLLIVVTHLLLHDYHEENITFFELYSVIGSSISLTFAIYSIMLFKENRVGNPWLLLAIGVSVFIVFDVISYDLRLVGAYDWKSPASLLWLVGCWITAYALYKHPQNLRWAD